MSPARPATVRAVPAGAPLPEHLTRPLKCRSEAWQGQQHEEEAGRLRTAGAAARADSARSYAGKPVAAAVRTTPSPSPASASASASSTAATRSLPSASSAAGTRPRALPSASATPQAAGRGAGPEAASHAEEQLSVAEPEAGSLQQEAQGAASSGGAPTTTTPAPGANGRDLEGSALQAMESEVEVRSGGRDRASGPACMQPAVKLDCACVWVAGWVARGRAHSRAHSSPHKPEMATAEKGIACGGGGRNEQGGLRCYLDPPKSSKPPSLID